MIINIINYTSLDNVLISSSIQLNLLHFRVNETMTFLNKFERASELLSSIPSMLYKRVKESLHYIGVNLPTLNASPVLCNICIFWFRLKNSMESAFTVNTATDICEYEYVPKKFCKFLIQTGHSLSAKYFYDERELEKRFCINYCHSTLQ